MAVIDLLCFSEPCLAVTIVVDLEMQYANRRAIRHHRSQHGFPDV